MEQWAQDIGALSTDQILEKLRDMHLEPQNQHIHETVAAAMDELRKRRLTWTQRTWAALSWEQFYFDDPTLTPHQPFSRSEDYTGQALRELDRMDKRQLMKRMQEELDRNTSVTLNMTRLNAIQDRLDRLDPIPCDPDMQRRALHRLKARIQELGL